MMIRWGVALCAALQLGGCFLVNSGEPEPGDPLIVDGGPDAVSGPECSGAGCTAEVVADLQPSPGALASDNVDLFWGNEGTSDDLGNLRNGAIMARPLSGGEVRVVVPGLKAPRMLAVWNDYLYWWSEYSVWRAPKDGSADKAIVYESSESIHWMEFSFSDTAIVVLDSVGGDAQIITIDPDDLSQSAFAIGSRRAWSLSVSNQTAYTLTGNESSAERELLAISLVDQNYSVLSTENEHYASVASDDTSLFVYGPSDTGIFSRNLDTDDMLNLFDSYPISNLEVAPTRLIVSYSFGNSLGDETGLWLVPKDPATATHLLDKEATRVNGTVVVDGVLYWSESNPGEVGTIRKYTLPAQ